LTPSQSISNLEATLLDSAPTSNCSDPEEIAALLGNVEIGPNNEVVKFINKAIQTGQHIADSAKTEVENFKKDPVGTVLKTPGNAIREFGRGFQCIFGCKD